MQSFKESPTSRWYVQPDAEESMEERSPRTEIWIQSLRLERGGTRKSKKQSARWQKTQGVWVSESTCRKTVSGRKHGSGVRNKNKGSKESPRSQLTFSSSVHLCSLCCDGVGLGWEGFPPCTSEPSPTLGLCICASLNLEASFAPLGWWISTHCSGLLEAYLPRCLLTPSWSCEPLIYLPVAERSRSQCCFMVSMTYHTGE